jgi:UDPglucose 6-dehydrogenase
MITVFGLGFVGLTTALGFAHFGHKVYGIDINEQRKALLRQRQLPFLEKDLDIVLNKELNNNFFIAEDIKASIEDSEVIYYCVGTPYGENGEADLTYLYQAIDETLACLGECGKEKVLVIKSTIPPSTTQNRILPYIKSKIKNLESKIILANNPEFLREGHCWEDFIQADRIIIGSAMKKEIGVLKEIYTPFDIPIYFVEHNTAEFIKYLSNTLLATMISYSNEMASIAYKIGDINISDSFHLLHMDKRWNNCNMTSYVYPGCGYGGYCLPKDTNALYSLAKNKGIETPILKYVIETNDNMPKTVSDHIEESIDENMYIGILGLSFKPGSDDVREAASAKIIKELMSRGYDKIVGYDPVANDIFEHYYKFGIDYMGTLEDIIHKADILVILTAWNDFKNIKELTTKKVLDFRYMQ